ncbi:ribonuclease P protein component [bacterium]|nr:ribonuclease P protein component [bacterium]
MSRNGRRYGSDFFQLRILANFLELNRLGIVIPMKAVRKAVERNRIRRMVKESLRTLPVELKMGFDIVIMVRSKPDVDKMQFVQDSIVKLLKSAELIESG